MEAIKNLALTPKSLAQDLAKEAFCRELQLEQVSLSKVSQVLEEQGTSFANQESLARFRNLFCQFLFALDAEAALTDSRLAELSIADFLPQTDGTVIGIINYSRPQESDTESVSWDPPAEETANAVQEGPSSAKALEYYTLAQYFQTQRTSQPSGIAIAHWIRLETQALCSAIEVEVQELSAQAIAKFWDTHQKSISHVWDPDSAKPEFHPAILAYWNMFIPAYWPSSEPLPLLTLKNSLRFLAASTEARIPQPSLLELGLWLFLFGQESDLGGFKLQNAMDLPEFEAPILADIFFRLCRIHRLKASLLNPLSGISEALQSEAHEHAVAVFAFSQNWRNGAK